MTIQTRYRDIPWEETGCPTTLNPTGIKEWKKFRGTEITVQVPSWTFDAFSTEKTLRSTCTEPKYRVVGKTRVSVCPHIAEIGD